MNDARHVLAWAVIVAVLAAGAGLALSLVERAFASPEGEPQAFPFGLEAVRSPASSPSGGYASSFGPGLYGNRLACGGRLWRSTHAVAHRSLPCGTPLRVCYRRRCQTLRVRDRGPWISSRSLDITEAAVRRFGVASARRWGVRYVEWEEATDE